MNKKDRTREDKNMQEPKYKVVKNPGKGPLHDYHHVVDRAWKIVCFVKGKSTAERICRLLNEDEQ